MNRTSFIEYCVLSLLCYVLLCDVEKQYTLLLLFFNDVLRWV